MKRILSLALLLVFIAIAGVWAADTGQDAGKVELDLVQDILTGNIGFSIGLIVCLVGIFGIIRGNTAGGVTFIVLGVLITLTPTVYNVAYYLFCPAVSALSGAACH